MKRILLVDDDPKPLATLAAALASHAGDWAVECAEGPEAALAALAARPFDAVVCDLQMPRKNGAAVLQTVRSSHPGAIRMILAGPGDVVASSMAMHVAHQFLTKPCPGRVLVPALERALRIHDQLGRELAPLVCGVTSLPSPPRTFQVLTAAMANPDVDLDNVVQQIGTEMSIGMKVLQLANSSSFGLGRPLANLKQAVTYLGLRTLRQLVLGAEVFGGIETVRLAREFDLAEEQRHAVAIARIASEVVAGDPATGDQAFSAALLHDIGEFVLAADDPDRFRRSEAVVAAHRRGERTSAEDRDLLDLHARVGGYLAGVWGLPDPVVDAILHHHRPSRSPEPPGLHLAGIVHVADCLFHALAAANPSAGQRVVERMLDRDWLDAAGCADRIDDWLDRAAALGVEAPTARQTV